MFLMLTLVSRCRKVHHVRKQLLGLSGQLISVQKEVTMLMERAIKVGGLRGAEGPCGATAAEEHQGPRGATAAEHLHPDRGSCPHLLCFSSCRGSSLRRSFLWSPLG